MLWLAGCNTLVPSNHREWSPDQALLASAEINGDLVKVHNVRDCKYQTMDDYVVSHYDKTYDLNHLNEVDFIIAPFPENPSLAHTMLSFGFDQGDFLAVSVEIRKEKGEHYSALNSIIHQYELMYVLGDERDLLELRTNHRLEEVYLYKARATQEQARTLFLDVMERVNQLASKPEFYDPFLNNCTTNLVRHVNRLSPSRIPLDYRFWLTGYSDRLAYDLGLLDTDLPFEEAKKQALVNGLAWMYRDRPDFSRKIRDGLAGAGKETGATSNQDTARPASVRLGPRIEADADADTGSTREIVP